MLLLPAAPALAAPPANDNRANAQVITPPDTVDGTVTEATVEPFEGGGGFCQSGDSSVWYRFTAPPRGSVIIQLDAGGNLDATVDVFQPERSNLNFQDCADTDKKGLATLAMDGLKGDYLIRVTKRFNSDPGDFKLGVLVPSPAARPPGKALPARGAKDSTDSLLNPSDAWAYTMTAGRTYRLSLTSDTCTGLSVFEPGTGSFDAEAVKTLHCGGYRLFTPETTGRYSLLVAGQRSVRGLQPYQLNVKPAGPDDTTPGIFIRNRAKVRGRVNGHADSVDYYRFDVTSRSSLNLTATGGPTLTLLKPGGRRLSSGSGRISLDVQPGRYYVAVRGRGSYRLRRISKVITHSRVTFDGQRHTRLAPGQSAQLVLGVNPSVNGRSTITLQKFDPLDGWQFLRRIHPTVVNGRAVVTFTPPSIGRYRAIAEFRGSKIASPSSAGIASINVRNPVLQQR